MDNSNKIGFWTVFALVVGSQIGSGILMVPAALAPFGVYSIISWLVAGLGAMSLAMVFAQLCTRFPETGGPHVYVKHVFGDDIAFFVGWTYWVISWASSTTVVVAAISYFSAIFDITDQRLVLLLEASLVIVIGYINLLGVDAASKAESFFAALKIAPLLIFPAIALPMFDYNNLIATDVIQGQSIAMSIAQASLITLWGFIGLESATTPAGSVMNPGITIPRAIIVGTGIVALIYLLNSVAIMGLIPGGDLHVSTAPYTDAARYLFGGNWHIFISLMATIICVGTLNAWILTSGQISLGLANDKLLPFIFSKKNIKGAPYASILISCLCMLPLILLMANKDMGKEVEYAIEVSVTSFLFIYLLCSLTNLRLILQESGVFNFGALVSIIAVLFCLWVLSESHYTTILCSGIFTLSGLPIYCFWYKRQDRLS